MLNMKMKICWAGRQCCVCPPLPGVGKCGKQNWNHGLLWYFVTCGECDTNGKVPSSSLIMTVRNTHIRQPLTLQLSVLEWGTKNSFEFIGGRLSVTLPLLRRCLFLKAINEWNKHWSGLSGALAHWQVQAELPPLPHNIHLQRSMQRSTVWNRRKMDQDIYPSI